MPFRPATLAAALFLAAPAAAQVTPQSPPKPAVAPPTTIEGDRIEGVSDIEVTARGNAEIRQGDTAIFGQDLRYNRELGRAQGEGGVRLTDGPDRFFGPRM